MKDTSNIYIYGKHVVLEALKSTPNNTIKKVFIVPNFNEQKTINLLNKKQIPMSPLFSLQETEKRFNSVAHQGIVALISQKKLIHKYSDFIGSLKITPDTALVVLGELKDPQNIGAIIRSADSFGVSGIFIPERNQAQITSSVIKISAGSVFKIPLITIGNVNNTLNSLKKKGFWIYGLEGDGEKLLCDEEFDCPTVIVVGGESDGIRKKTRDFCDIVLSIPIHPKCESLNAATATSVALYEWSKKHPNATSSL